MEVNKYVGAQIQKFRKLRGLTQDQLAEQLNTTRQTISRYESGTRKTDQDVLFELSKILNKPINSFFPEQEEKESSTELLAAHLDDDITEAEMEEITNFIEYIKHKKK